MSRPPRDLRATDLVFIDDDLTDAERHEALAAWLADFDARPGIEAGVRVEARVEGRSLRP